MNTGEQQSPQRLGKYELREILGRGGMAEVWLAFDTELERYVAIKFLHADLQADPEFITRFTREARVIASLHHPNIVQIHDFKISRSPESTTPTAYMVMDYVEGQTLADYIRSTSFTGRYPSPVDLVHLFTSISKAIDYAHQKGMIHRDIKPANILLDTRDTKLNPMGEPVLTDFGVAKLMGVVSASLIGMWLGTPLYMSPEQAQGHPGNERSDIYSLGVVLYEVCTGVQPFRGESVTAVMIQHMQALPTPPALINPSIPPALSMVILRCLAKDPSARFSNAATITAAMAEAFNLPVPADLSLSLFPPDDMSKPRYFRPLQQNLPSGAPPGALSSSPSIPMIVPYPLSVNPTIRQPAASPGGEQSFPTTPIDSTSGGSALAHAAQNRLATTPVLSPSAPPPARGRGRKGLFVTLLALFLLAVLSLSAALYIFPSQHALPPTTTTSPMVGDVYFLSSGQVNAQTTQGVDDEVQLNLHNIPNPAPGKRYYAWLRSVSLEGEGPWISIGPLSVSQGNAQLSSIYQDPQHADLLSDVRSFLVTEEDSSIVPISPSSDHSTWRFYSDPPTLILLHLGHLLAGSPELEVRQLSGGLGYIFSRNTEKLVEWVSSARDTAVLDNQPDTDLIHRQIIHILDYIDGINSVSMDVPPGTPLDLIPGYASNGQIALVGPTPRIEPAGNSYKGEIAPGYVYLIPVHLDAAMAVPGATAQQHQLANQIHAALNLVTHDLEQARQYARQLVTLSGTQLLTPQAKAWLNDLYVAVKSAYTGPDDPTLPQGGATGIYNNLQLLATFEVQKSTTQ